MFKEYKKSLILSSLGILLPTLLGLLLWNRLPDMMPTHWGIHGQADGFGGKAFTVFGLPLIMLAVYWLCLFLTYLDPKNRGRNRKGFLLVMWIMPLISNFCSAMVYGAAMGHSMNIGAVVLIPVGLLFIVIGNYTPKFQQNHTMGIKLTWTLANEENWNLTHRFGGKCWVAGGFSMLLSALLPGEVSIWILIAGILVMVLLPTLYSYRIYRRHKAQGIVYPPVNLWGSKKYKRISIVFLVLLFVFLGWIMFTGDITYSLGEDSFTIEADFYGDLTVSYDSIDAIEFREGAIPGLRTSGFQSARLLMGFFQNEEFGSYTRYTYTKPDGCIVLRSGQKVLVLSAERYSETLKLYLQLMEATSLS